MNSDEIKNLVLDQGKAFTEFKKANDERLKNLEKNLSVFAKKTGQREIPVPKRTLNNH
ncbi:MAG: hypothetical protein J0I60_13435 [Nitrosospira sp.]|nr:hypothetical protein [Nitrosospira sp.]